jgi:hypothetical protein
VKIGKNPSETLAPLKLAMKKSSVFNGTGNSCEGEKMCKVTQEMGSYNHKGQIKMWCN